MERVKLRQEIRRLSIEERLEVIEVTLQAIREDLEVLEAASSHLSSLVVRYDEILVENYVGEVRRLIDQLYESGRYEQLSEMVREARQQEESLTRVSANDEDELAKRHEAIEAVVGKYAFVPTSSEEFACRKQEEIELER